MGNLIIALDMSDKKQAFSLIDLFKNFKSHDRASHKKEVWFKVGMELFYSSGGELLHELHEKGCKIFLDLKLHDIPQTVYKTMKTLAQFPFHMVNVHALGGHEMMKRATEAIKEHPLSPNLIAVTQLTSTNQSQMTHELHIKGNLIDSVLHLAKLAQSTGCHGVVCSPHEVKEIKTKLGKQFITVCPGIRPLSHQETRDDQKRFMTPQEAKTQGTNFMVIGRPITQSSDPLKTYQEILLSMED